MDIVVDLNPKDRKYQFDFSAKDFISNRNPIDNIKNAPKDIKITNNRKYSSHIKTCPSENISINLSNIQRNE